MLLNRIKLCKALLKLAEIATDKGNLIYEGELAEGIEVFIDVDGEIVPAEDGEYIAEEQKLKVEGGKVVSIEAVEKSSPEEPKEEKVEEESEEDSKVAELEAVIAEKDAKIEELEKKVSELEAQLSEKEEKLQMSSDIPAKEKVKKIATPKTNLKFYQFQ
jgi:uncharacterized coiled-coil protein SlyX